MPDPLDFAEAIATHYSVEREIGRGGMGIVYLARDARLDRYVAIKTLPPHLATDPIVRERFLREARTAGALSHQNIVPIHRADEIQGHVFFVMGYVAGESLAQRVRRVGRLDPREAVSILIDVANALGYAHSRGVIHRDVKAENILIEESSGRALVTDFGIARLSEAGPLTSTGQVLGTVYYLSPEQVSGDKIDARSDIYSLGVVAYLALSGQFPFDGELASAVLIAHVTKPPPPLLTRAPDIPRELAEIVDRVLRRTRQIDFPTVRPLPRPSRNLRRTSRESRSDLRSRTYSLPRISCPTPRRSGSGAALRICKLSRAFRNVLRRCQVSATRARTRRVRAGIALATSAMLPRRPGSRTSMCSTRLSNMDS